MNTETTADDLRACFRLLLNREPGQNEWQWHKHAVGRPLSGVVASFLGSREFQDRGLVGSDRKVELAECRGWRMYVCPDDLLTGACILQTGTYEPEVSSVFRRYLRIGMTVLDIGANVGYYTLLAASVIGPKGRIIAVEPNPRNVRLLLASAALNGYNNIQVLQTAVGRDWGVSTLYTDGSQGIIRNCPVQSLLSTTTETVNLARLDDMIHERLDLIKIDVEGYELEALFGCSRIIKEHRPVIFTEFSPPNFVGSPEAYLRFLEENGYRLSVLRHDGPFACAREQVMIEFRRVESDHIDLLAERFDPQ